MNAGVFSSPDTGLAFLSASAGVSHNTLGLEKSANSPPPGVIVHPASTIILVNEEQLGAQP